MGLAVPTQVITIAGFDDWCVLDRTAAISHSQLCKAIFPLAFIHNVCSSHTTESFLVDNILVELHRKQRLTSASPLVVVSMISVAPVQCELHRATFTLPASALISKGSASPGVS